MTDDAASGDPGPEVVNASAVPARSSVNIPPGLHAISRAAVRLVRRKTGRDYPMRQFVEEAITAQIREIADTYNDGRAIQPDDVPLEKGGNHKK
ncbi:hypothetical protein [Mycobacteroides abscessus]|uniref:hypothetical protein n=1 Tax=Mycobacteroides abscessus TaxID=36809 RepID=UPI000928BF18|nr:hypothetical protein [Mycobacteroides abscessus]SHY27487.1 Uncharacterised protein [Mycobacteroides abscessus subsp. abscessus]SID72843.1 Uncharacterised protein [Mycobacteroides abscessus subsp. abscessus]SII82204.1 Uncharacterised protein [Mycobacteroides abscessus subsp. abscessus]SIJ00908.1 Uncharacterised protein [Mycobacteroides abscessus subsp. abscessus]SIK18150.1 Uncharacterised protein [Mycobacteroides abscessus subsp. abscessus]